MPIEIVFDMLGFNMLNPKMKNHPPFVLPRLANMQRSQHTNLLKRKTAFDFFACLSYSCGPQRLTKVANAHIWILLTATMLTLQSAKTYKDTPRIELTFAVRKDILSFMVFAQQSTSSADRRSQIQRQWCAEPEVPLWPTSLLELLCSLLSKLLHSNILLVLPNDHT